MSLEMLGASRRPGQAAPADPALSSGFALVISGGPLQPPPFLVNVQKKVSNFSTFDFCFLLLCPSPSALPVAHFLSCACSYHGILHKLSAVQDQKTEGCSPVSRLQWCEASQLWRLTSHGGRQNRIAFVIPSRWCKSVLYWSWSVVKSLPDKLLHTSWVRVK